MLPDDPRHGSQAGYRAHRKAGEDACDSCKRGAAATEALNVYRRSKGLSGRLSPVGCQRRLQALAALGYDWKTLGEHLGMTGTGVTRLALESSYMRPATAAKVVALYERLSMTLPPLETTAQRNAASRARNRAARNGWPVPLAWDNIDDETEQPRDWRYQSPDRAEAVRDMAEMGLGITEVCRRLHTSADTLQKWCDRRGLSDVYRQIAAREALRENQYARKSA